MIIEKTRTLGIVATAATLLTAGLAGAQESPQGTLQSITVDEFDPNIIYAAGAGHIYRSEDAGSSWVSVQDNVFAWSLAVGPFEGLTGQQPQKIHYAATTDRGVMRSTNGFGWHETGGLTGGVRSVTPHPDGNTAFAGADLGIYKSTDRGANWRLAGGPIGPGTTQAIVIDPNNHNAVYATRWGQGVYRSIDGGETWLLGNSGLFDTQLFDLAIHPANSSVLYAATFSGVYRSVDAAASWVPLDSPTRTSAIAIDPTNGNRIFIATEGNGISRSDDGGQTWRVLDNGLQGVSHFVSVAVSPDTGERVYVGTINQGLFISDDRGESWRLASNGGVPELPPIVSPPPTTQPSAATTLTVKIIDRNGGRVEFGERANFDVIVRNTGREVARDTIIRIFWQQLQYPNNYRSAIVSWPSGSCGANEECRLGNLLPNTELRLSVSGGTSSDWIGPFLLSLDGQAANSNGFSGSMEVAMTRTILTAEDSSGGGAIDLLFFIFGLGMLLLRSGQSARFSS